MRTRNAGTIGLLAAGLVLAGTATSKAQTVIEGQTARENVQAEAITARAPGRMVEAGLGRVQVFTQATAGGVTITEQREPSIPAQAFATAITTVFDQLNTSIVLFHNLLLARAGSPPVIPTGFLPTAGNGNSGGETSGSPDGELGDLNLGDFDLGDLDLGGLVDQSGATGSKAAQRD